MGEYNLELEDRLYTSTEVAKILGVSLRSVYRYLEDDKLDAEMKTATGRHRFTKQNILDFLYPQKDEKKEEKEVKEEEEVVEKEEVEEEVVEEVEETEDVPEEDEEDEEVGEEEAGEEEEEDEEEVDWLSKFRKAAEKYKAESEEEEEEDEEDEEVDEEEAGEEEEDKEKEEVSGLAGDEKEEEEEDSAEKMYYTSEAGGLKDVAQKLDKSARKASLDYAFTMQAGLSLHKPISPFSLIHAYVKSEDLPFFEKILDLNEADKNDAQLCLIIADEDSVYKEAVEMHGLNVVADKKLKEDLLEAGEEELAEEL